MKSKIALILSLLIMLCSCNILPKPPEKKENSFSGGVWISYSEINRMLLSEEGFEAELEKAVKNCNNLHIENVYIHVRPFCDSLYPSKIFPLNSNAKKYDYDIFEKMIEVFHQSFIKVHAWVNPYRVLTSSSNIEDVNAQSPAYKWLTDDEPENDLNVCIYNGIYLNPASESVQKLVMDGIREIITNYNVDGIHFDDYFYPTKNEDFDKQSYEIYKNSSTNPLSLDDWRRQNVNNLISGCYLAIKSLNDKIMFSVSPAASIQKNYADLYADVEEWIVCGYIDTVIPQLYFGYNYSDENFRFDVLLEDWVALCEKNEKVGLLVGLAFYKIGSYSEADTDEWQTQTDIIARQVSQCYQNQRFSGYVAFSYSSLFSDESLNLKQRNALLKIIGGENKNE